MQQQLTLWTKYQLLHGNLIKSNKTLWTECHLYHLSKQQLTLWTKYHLLHDKTLWSEYHLFHENLIKNNKTLWSKYHLFHGSLIRKITEPSKPNTIYRDTWYWGSNIIKLNRNIILTFIFLVKIPGKLTLHRGCLPWFTKLGINKGEHENLKNPKT